MNIDAYERSYEEYDTHKSPFVKFLRVFACVCIVIGFIGGIYFALTLGQAAGAFEGEMAWGVFFIVLIAYWLSTALIFAVLMIYADNAENIQRTEVNTRNTARAIEKMAKVGKGDA